MTHYLRAERPDTSSPRVFLGYVVENKGLRKLAWTLRGIAILVLLCDFAACSAAFAQQLFAQKSSSEDATPAPVSPTSLYLNGEHPFLDRENIWLFAGVGVSRTLDYFSTLNMRRRGRQEILLSDWVVDRHALFAGIEVGGTALSIGASYWLHRTGHHRLERAFSMAHIGLATTGAVRNYGLQTFRSANRGLD